MAAAQNIPPPSGTPIKGWEPAFLIGSGKSLRLIPEMTDSRTSDYLAHWLARHPQDLLRHVQRINLHSDHAEPERLFAALVDLFIALDDRGLALRRRELDGARRQLGYERLRFLEQSLPTGLTANHRLGDIPGSVLSRPVDGALDVLVRSDSVRRPVVRPVLEEARTLVDEGYISKPRLLQETGLADTPRDAGLAGKLRPTHNRQGYLQFRQILGETDVLLPAWRKAVFDDRSQA